MASSSNGAVPWRRRSDSRLGGRGRCASQQQHPQHSELAEPQPQHLPQQSQQPQPQPQHLQPQPDAPGSAAAPRPQLRRALLLAAHAGVVLATGVANRLLYKGALLPMENYVFFLALLQGFGYVLVYGAVLALRWRAGHVSAEALAVPRRHARTFGAIGLVEALASLLGFVGAAKLPGVVLPLLSQTLLLWQVLLGRVLLRKRLSGAQLAGCAAVVAGVCLAAWPTPGAASPVAGVAPLYAGVFVFSMLFPALDVVLKEKLFRDAAAALGGAQLDLFVVNSAGSAAQALFIAALLPLMAGLRGIAMGQLPAYLAQGWQCFRGLTPACGSDCSGAPLLPLLYVAMNLLLNVFVLSLIRLAGNVTVSLCMSAVVPLTIYAFTLPLPLLGPPPPLGGTFVVGASLLVAGLALYNSCLWLPHLAHSLQHRRWAVAPMGAPADPGGSAAAAA